MGSPLGIGLAVGRFALILTNTLLALDVNNAASVLFGDSALSIPLPSIVYGRHLEYFKSYHSALLFSSVA